MDKSTEQWPYLIYSYQSRPISEIESENTSSFGVVTFWFMVYYSPLLVHWTERNELNSTKDLIHLISIE